MFECMELKSESLKAIPEASIPTLQYRVNPIIRFYIKCQNPYNNFTEWKLNRSNFFY